jgi:hypothetical protein
VIDYGIVNEEAWERVEKFRIEERVESDHLEMALWRRRGGKEQRRKGVGDRNKTVHFYFFGIAVLCLNNKLIINKAFNLQEKPIFSYEKYKKKSGAFKIPASAAI